MQRIIVLLLFFCCLSCSAFSRRHKPVADSAAVAVVYTPDYFVGATYTGKHQEHWHGFNHFFDYSHVTVIDYIFTFKFAADGRHVTITSETVPQKINSPTDYVNADKQVVTKSYIIKDNILIIDSFIEFKIKGKTLIANGSAGNAFPVRLIRK